MIGAGLEGRYEEILGAVAEGITVQGIDGRLLWANVEGARILGFPTVAALFEASLAEVLDRFELVDVSGAPFDPALLPGRRALAGEEPPEALVGWRNRKSGEDRWSSVRAKPVFDSAGRVQFAVNLFRDVTERHRAQEALRRSEERFAFLASASRTLLGASRDLRTVVERLAELAVPMLGEWCSVWELSGDGVPGHSAARVAERYRHGLATDLAEVHEAIRASAPWSSMRRGQSVLVADLTPEARSAAPIPAGLLRLVEELDVRSGMLVPIQTVNEVVGALLVASTVPGRYGQAEIALVEDLARRAGVAIENARLYAERATAAGTLARALVPSSLPTIPGIEIAAWYRPATSGVGGDFYDVVELGEGRWLLVIGDVCGKGPEAASLTAMTRYTLRALAPIHDGPSALLSATNALLTPQFPEDRFCTLACVCLTPTVSGAEVVVAVAGHPRPICVTHDGRVQACGRPGAVLGAFDDLEVEDEKVDLGPGDSIVLFTDGCVGEGVDASEVLGPDLGAASGGGPRALADAVAAAALGADPAHPDDVAILVAGVPLTAG